MLVVIVDFSTSIHPIKMKKLHLDVGTPYV